jgi:hypothetical protein
MRFLSHVIQIQGYFVQNMIDRYCNNTHEMNHKTKGKEFFEFNLYPRLFTYFPMKMEQTECSETTKYKNSDAGELLRRKHTTSIYILNCMK